MCLHVLYCVYAILEKGEKLHRIAENTCTEYRDCFCDIHVCSTPRCYDSTPQHYDNTPQYYDSTPQYYDYTPQYYDSIPQYYDSTPQ